MPGFFQVCGEVPGTNSPTPHPLTSVLPDVVVITSVEARGTGPGAAVDLIAAEAGGTGPGAPAVMIAHEVGYDSEFAFARAFKRATGSAPGQHRKLTQTND